MSTSLIRKLREKSQEEPYYISFKDPEKYLKWYLGFFEDEYYSKRAATILRMFPQSKSTSESLWLDVGCGGGFYASLAAQEGVGRIVLVDTQPTCVKAAKINMSRYGNLKVHVVIADALRLPFRRDCFDVALCIDLIEHLSSDKRFLYNLHSIMKTRGLLIISTQNSSSLNYLIEGFLQRHILKNRCWKGWDSTHLRFYDLSSLTEIVGQSHFRIIKVAGTYFVPYKLGSFAVGLLSSNLSQAFSKVFARINGIFEKLSAKPFWNLHGWGLVCISTKASEGSPD